MRTFVSLMFAGSFVIGCAEPIHLGYDHGRAFTQTFEMQADLTRASVVDISYDLYGVEAEAIRLNLRSQATDDQGLGEGGGQATGVQNPSGSKK